MRHLLLISLLIPLMACPAWAAESDAEPAKEKDLAPMTPSLDTNPDIDAKPHTLKGNIEHHTGAAKKKMKAAVNKEANRRRALLQQRTMLDKMPQIPGLRADYTFEQSVGIIGIRFMKDTGKPAIIERVFAGTPAARLGLEVYDKIVAVDGIPLIGLNREECFDLMIGEPESSVTLSINRNGSFLVKQIIRMDFNRIPDLSVRRSYLMAL